MRTMTTAEMNVFTHAVTVELMLPFEVNHTMMMQINKRSAYAKKNTPCPMRHTEITFRAVRAIGFCQQSGSSTHALHGLSSAIEPIDVVTVIDAAPDML